MVRERQPARDKGTPLVAEVQPVPGAGGALAEEPTVCEASPVADGSKRTGLIGAAGEYHVVAQLSQRGWLATITIKNSPGTDVLAQHVETGVLVALQTKTTEIAAQGWILGAKDETPTDRADSWYVLVGMNGELARALTSTSSLATTFRPTCTSATSTGSARLARAGSRTRTTGCATSIRPRFRPTRRTGTPS